MHLKGRGHYASDLKKLTNIKGQSSQIAVMGMVLSIFMILRHLPKCEQSSFFLIPSVQTDLSMHPHSTAPLWKEEAKS